MLASLFTMSPFSSTKMLGSLANGAPNGNKHKIAGELSWHLEVAKRAVSNYMANADGERRGRGMKLIIKGSSAVVTNQQAAKR